MALLLQLQNMIELEFSSITPLEEQILCVYLQDNTVKLQIRGGGYIKTYWSHTRWLLQSCNPKGYSLGTPGFYQLKAARIDQDIA